MQLAGQIARAAAVFRIDEVSVFISLSPSKCTFLLGLERCLLWEVDVLGDWYLVKIVDAALKFAEEAVRVVLMWWSLFWQIVVFDDGDEGSRVPKWSEGATETSGSFLCRLLKYMETPQYLRLTLCPKHRSLQCAVWILTLSYTFILMEKFWCTTLHGRSQLF